MVCLFERVRRLDQYQELFSDAPKRLPLSGTTIWSGSYMLDVLTPSQPTQNTVKVEATSPELLPSFTVSDTSSSLQGDDTRERWWRGRRPLDPNAIPPVPDVKRVLLPSVYLDSDDFGELLTQLEGPPSSLSVADTDTRQSYFSDNPLGPLPLPKVLQRKGSDGPSTLSIGETDGRNSYLSENPLGPLPLPKVLQRKGSDMSIDLPHDLPHKKSMDSMSVHSRKSIKDTLLSSPVFSKFGRAPTTPPLPPKDKYLPPSPVHSDMSDVSWRPDTSKTDLSMELYEWNSSLGRKAVKNQPPREPNAVERTAELLARLANQKRAQFISITYKVQKATTGLPYWLTNHHISTPPDHLEYLGMALYTTKRNISLLRLPMRGQPEKELPSIPLQQTMLLNPQAYDPDQEVVNRLCSRFPYEKRHILENTLSRAKGNEVVALKLYVEQRSKEQKYNLPMPVEKKMAPTSMAAEETEAPPPPPKDKKSKWR